MVRVALLKWSAFSSTIALLTQGSVPNDLQALPASTTFGTEFIKLTRIMQSSLAMLG